MLSRFLLWYLHFGGDSKRQNFHPINDRRHWVTSGRKASLTCSPICAAQTHCRSIHRPHPNDTGEEQQLHCCLLNLGSCSNQGHGRQPWHCWVIVCNFPTFLPQSWWTSLPGDFPGLRQVTRATGKTPAEKPGDAAGPQNGKPEQCQPDQLF